VKKKTQPPRSFLERARKSVRAVSAILAELKVLVVEIAILIVLVVWILESHGIHLHK